MPPRATGTVEVHPWKDGRTVTYRGRVRAYGGRYRLDFGTNHQGWSEERAAVELERIIGQIERGTWEPPKREIVDVADFNADVTFHVFASWWWAQKKLTLSPNAAADYRWRLDHLLGYFHALPVGSITCTKVDQYRAVKLRERQALAEAHAVARAQKKQLPRRRPLSNRSINMTLELLAQILDDAMEQEPPLLDANPARGRKRRLPRERTRRSFLEPDMVVDLLEAASTIERRVPPHQQFGRRALLATLCLAGPRITELTTAPRSRLDLAGGRLRVGESKTEAGLRDVELTFYLQDEIRAHLAAMTGLGRPAGAAVPLFPTRTGGRHSPSNVRNRLLTEAVRLANEAREQRGAMLLPEHVTPHTLRRTFATLALTAGRDPRWVMAQLGHTDARLTLNLYAQMLQRQRVEYELVWELMRFADEPETWGTAPSSGPTNGPTPARGAAPWARGR